MKADVNEEETKDIISWNAALTTAYLNVSCMEASLAISRKKKQIRDLNKNHLSGEVTLGVKLDGISDEAKWKEITEQKKNKHQNESQRRIDIMTDDAKKIKADIQAEINDVLQNIERVQRTISEAETLQKNEASDIANVTEQDIINIQEKIRLAQMELEQLNAPQTPNPSPNYSRMQNSTTGKSNVPTTIFDVLNATKPKVPNVV